MKFFKKNSKLLIFLLITNSSYAAAEAEAATKQWIEKEARAKAAEAAKTPKTEGGWFKRFKNYVKNPGKFATENKGSLIATFLVGTGIAAGTIGEKYIRPETIYNNILDKFQSFSEEELKLYVKGNIEKEKNYILNNLNDKLIKELDNILDKIETSLKEKKYYSLNDNDKKNIEKANTIIVYASAIKAFNDNEKVTNKNKINIFYNQILKKLINIKGKNNKFIINNNNNNKELKDTEPNIKELKNTYLFKIINEINNQQKLINQQEQQFNQQDPKSSFWSNNKNTIYKSGIAAGVLGTLGIAGYAWKKHLNNKKLQNRADIRRANTLRNKKLGLI